MGKKLSFQELNTLFDQKTKELNLTNIIVPFIFYTLFFLLYELCYAVADYIMINGEADILCIERTSFPFCFMTAGLICIFPRKAQRVVFPLTSVFWLVYGFAQLTVTSSNGSMVRFVNITTGKDAAGFAGAVLKELPLHIYVIHGVFLLITVLAVIFLYRERFFDMKKLNKTAVRLALGALSAAMLTSVILYVPIKDPLSNSFYIYDNFLDTNHVFLHRDLYGYAVKDIQCYVTAKKKAEEKKALITEYFADRPAHEDNDMTGIFKDKNLLVVQLESFDKDLITSGHCSKLKEIYDKSMVFDNYYGMRFGSEPTIGNEMAVNTGYYATTDLAAGSGLNDIVFPYSLSKIFLANSYSTDVYHYNDPSFYQRDSTERTFGYNKYTYFKDLTDREDVVFEDDLCIVECDDIYNAIVSGGRTMHYFIGFSAHPPYVITDLNSNESYGPGARYLKVKERHPDYEFDPDNKMELYRAFALLADDMAGALIDRMEKDGSIKDTVILFVSDHACLETMENTTDASSYFDTQKIPCFIYADGMEPMTIEKTCSNIDLLPTLVNMFGLEYDNVFIGNDVFNDSTEGLAYLPSFNWVTDKCKYINGAVSENYTDEEIDEEYIKHINDLVYMRIEINNLVLYTNYFADNSE